MEIQTTTTILYLCPLHVTCFIFLECFLALRQDFTAIDGHWDTASKLAAILCQCCVGLELPKVTEYKKTFLRDVVENVLTLAAKLQDLYCRSKKVQSDIFYVPIF